MSYRDEIIAIMAFVPLVGVNYVLRRPAAEIAARADARITELEIAITVRDTEIARLETDLELAQVDHARMRRLDDLWVRKLVAGEASEGQAAKATGLNRIELRKRADELDAAIDAARGDA